MNRYPLKQLSKEEIEERENTKDGMRNAIGFIDSSEVEQFISFMTEKSKEKEIFCEVNKQRLGWGNSEKTEIKINFKSEDFPSVHKVSSSNVPIGLFLEPMKNNPNQYSIWIYFTVKKRMLTAFKKTLLTEWFVL